MQPVRPAHGPPLLCEHAAGCAFTQPQRRAASGRSGPARVSGARSHLRRSVRAQKGAAAKSTATAWPAAAASSTRGGGGEKCTRGRTLSQGEIRARGGADFVFNATATARAFIAQDTHPTASGKRREASARPPSADSAKPSCNRPIDAMKLFTNGTSPLFVLVLARLARDADLHLKNEAVIEPFQLVRVELERLFLGQGQVASRGGG